MKIKNICNKIIGIGNVNLVPDAVTVIPDKVANTPAVKAFIKRGYLVVVSETAPAETVANDEKPADKPAEKPAKSAAKNAKAEASVADTASTDKAE